MPAEGPQTLQVHPGQNRSAKNIVLSGASGFLGGHLCSALVRAGHKVTALVRSTSNTEKLRALRVRIVEVDRPAELRAYDWQAVELFVHTATNFGRGGITSAQLLRDNVLYPLELLALLPSETPVINTDSFFSKPALNNTYLAGYTLCKQQLLDWLHVDKQRVVVNARLEHMYGPDDSVDKFITGTLEKLLRNEKKIALTDGLQERDFVFVHDVVEAYLQIITRLSSLAPGLHEVEVGTGQSSTVRSLVELMKLVSGSETLLDFGAIPIRAGEVKASCADISRLQAWGWTPQWLQKKGIEQCVTELRDRLGMSA